VVLKKEIETLKNKLGVLEASRNTKNEEVKKLKVRVAEIEAETLAAKNEAKEQSEKYQSSLKALEEERRQKGRIQAELNGYKEDAKVGGNVGGKMSYEQLQQRNKELE
jgi:chromosome segregation ATPase